LRTRSARKSLVAVAGRNAAAARIRKMPEESRAVNRCGGVAMSGVAMIVSEPEVCAKGRGILI
jgi:hypothetical protein